MFNFMDWLMMDELHPNNFTLRSPHWSTVRKEFLRKNPKCILTGTNKDLDVHHVKPFHLYPNLELEESNLRTISHPYHFLIGHLCCWSNINSEFDWDVGQWAARIRERK